MSQKLEAIITPYSSVVGGGLQLIDKSGAVKAMVIVYGAVSKLTKEESEEICLRLADGYNNPGGGNG